MRSNDDKEVQIIEALNFGEATSSKFSGRKLKQTQRNPRK
jgi:hypothetical protein